MEALENFAMVSSRYSSVTVPFASCQQQCLNLRLSKQSDALGCNICSKGFVTPQTILSRKDKSHSETTIVLLRSSIDASRGVACGSVYTAGQPSTEHQIFALVPVE